MTSIKSKITAIAFAIAAFSMTGQMAQAAPMAAPLGGNLQAAATTQAPQADIVKVGFKKGGRRRFGGHRHFRWHHAPYYGHVYYGGYKHRRCYWLKKKARRTGSKYWWNRYYNCRAYY